MEIIKDKDLGSTPLDERVAALERKVKEIDALVKGLTEELLDLKSVAMKLSKASEERARVEMRMAKPGTGGQGQGPIILQTKTRPAPAVQRPVQPPAQPVPEPEPEKMDMIMQPDGTLKPERRTNSDYIIASAGFPKKKQNVQGSGKKSELIVAEDKESESSEKR